MTNINLFLTLINCVKRQITPNAYIYKGYNNMFKYYPSWSNDQTVKSQRVYMV